ncbi:hypothetical protein ACFQFC_38780 [Amorphoplanes digitatis]|uniref:Uncharacterized protein n=1 Tax=Actinoplanes digitatis TaxID=1868 RepID=A0A7W7MPF9_9ACTN|nr:hypothetical protein [Actinoplanes digitatis]MBB4762113.1 hypothetical protein [Actinoplanes digitatis]BFE70871.1 hypothetical protein GCM10020092_041720 [Actinoplanes digitatis]GID96211.1 hypothetical protein Adi01nite_56230 [Actinoplanes digitatis]
MAVEGIGPANSTGSAARIEFQRFQEKVASDLAEKSAQRVAAADKEAVVKTDVKALAERQEKTGTVDLMV